MQNNALLRWYASKLDSHPLRTKIITSAAIAGTGDLLCQSFGLGSENTAEDTNDDRKHLHDHHHSKQHSHSAHSTSTNRYGYDISRTAKFAFLGAALVAPATHFWYGYLMTKIPGSKTSSVGKRLAFDQGLFAPLFLTTFVSCLTVLDHIVASIQFWTSARMSTTGTTDATNCQFDQMEQPPEQQQLHKLSMKYKSSPNDSSSSTPTPTVGMPPPHQPQSSLQSLILTRIQNDVPQSLIVGWSIWVPSMAYMFAYVPGKYQVLFSNSVGFVWNVYLSWRTHQ